MTGTFCAYYVGWLSAASQIIWCHSISDAKGELLHKLLFL
jgi:hypothetical protein